MGTGSTDLLDWRRATSATYARVRVASSPQQAHQLWVDERRRLATDSPVTPGPPPDVAPYHPCWRTECELRPSDPEHLEVPTGTDGTVVYDRLGHLATPWGDLDVWWLGGYGGGVWVPLRDTSPTTYGGGRYLYDTVKGADLGQQGTTFVVDLNFLYNPSCAYDAAWACPLAPEGNRWDLAVPVGELRP